MSLLKRTGTAIDDVTWDATELASKAELDAVKKTADSAKSTADTAKGVADAALPKAGGTMAGAINMNDKQVKNVGTPTDVNDAVTKKYVDDALSGVQPVGDYVNKSGDTMTGNLNMGNHQINNVNTMTVSNVIVKGTADSQVSIKTTGDASRSEIDLNDASDNPVVIKGVDTPADDMDAANKSYVDAVDAKVTAANAEITGVKNTVNGVVDGSVELPYLSKTGGAMSGNAVITGVTVPDNAPDDAVVTKGYVDNWHTLDKVQLSKTISVTKYPNLTLTAFTSLNSTLKGLTLKKGYGILVLSCGQRETADMFGGVDFRIQGAYFGSIVTGNPVYTTEDKIVIMHYLALRDILPDEEINVYYHELQMQAGSNYNMTIKVLYNLELAHFEE